MNYEELLEKHLEGKASLEDSVNLYLSTVSPERWLSLLSAASELRDKNLGRELILAAHLGMITPCVLNPPCAYCSASSKDYKIKQERELLSLEKLQQEVDNIKKMGVEFIHLVGGTNLLGFDELVKKAVMAVREVTDLPLEISVGPSLSRDTMRWLKSNGVFRIVCSLETINRVAFSEAKPGDNLDMRIDCMKAILEEGLELKSIVMNGLGDYRDLIESIHFHKQFKNLTSISISTFTPIKGTTWEGRAPASVWDSLKALSITRLLFPHADIGLPFGGGENLLPLTLMAGGGNVVMPVLIDAAKRVERISSTKKYASSLGFNLGAHSTHNE
ncbi:MAG: radical SAM protein [Nitrososphaeria archaeon]